MSKKSINLVAAELLAILGAFVEMSDDVLKANGAIDMQGRLLRLQSAIQRNKPRLRKYAADATKRLKAEGLMPEPSEEQPGNVEMVEF